MTLATKNVAITMDDTIADLARIEAAKRNTSVSRLIGELLPEKMRRDDSYAAAMRAALKFESIQFEAPFMTRDEIYAERLDRFC